MAILAWTWCPIGEPAAGRVMVVERHSTWESTEVPYGTEVYGEAGSYNYAAAYAYCGQFYAMSRLLESQAIDDAKLADCDVLIIKTPTARYEKQEVDAVVRFVARGGSLLLIGDHTNVFNMNTYLNDITRRFGFSFRNDLLFRVGSPYRQAYVPSWPPHPIVQHVPSMDFAVSCSIDPGFSRGRSVIRNSGLYNLPPAYHESNYHPQAEYRPAMQYGAWCQLWETRHGRGRVLAFADSTLFSNFCVYQPGKAELLRGMVDWLNHRESPAAAWGASLLRSLLLAASVALMIAGLRLAWKTPGSWMLLLGWSLGAGTVTCLALAGWQRSAMPVPVAERPLPHIGIDRGLSDVPLFTGAFADDDQGFGYGMFEQWIPRLGVTMSRVYTTENFRGQGLVVICPTRSVQDQTLDQLTQYVHQGGRLLVLDSPDVGDSTANSLLQPFGLTIRHDLASQIQGDLVWPDAAEIPVESLQTSCAVTGGQPLATIQGTPVAAQVAWGQGTVTAVGFGSLFNDAAMGFHWLPEPDPALLQRYQVLYHLLRCAVSPPQPPRMQSQTTPSQTTQVRGG